MIPDPTFTKGKHRSGQHWAKVMISLRRGSVTIEGIGDTPEEARQDLIYLLGDLQGASSDAEEALREGSEEEAA